MAAVGVDSEALRDAVTLDGVRAHQTALQTIATANNATRASGTPGYDASEAYVRGELQAAGYSVTTQPFMFPFFQEFSDSVLEVSPGTTLDHGTDYLTLVLSAAGDVTGPLVAADGIISPTPTPSSTSGCSAADFAGFPSGGIAVIQRGTCTFGEKVANAAAAGAAAAIVFNEGNPGRVDVFGGTLGAPATIPALAASFSVGQQLLEAAQKGGTAHIVVDALSETRTTQSTCSPNLRGRVTAWSSSGRTWTALPRARVSTTTAVARRHPRDRVRDGRARRAASQQGPFAFWGAEESDCWAPSTTSSS